MQFLNKITKLFLVKKLSLVIIVLLVFFNIAAVPDAISQSSKTTVVLYEQYQTMQFNEGQVVKLKGQVIYHPPGGFPTGISNVYYKIINQDNGQVIYDGYTDFDGLFSYDWLAESFGKRTTNLKAIFPGSGSYGYAESNTLILEIFSQLKTTYHNTNLILKIEDSSTAGYIRIYPQLTYGSGNNLSTDDVEIYVDGNYITSISSNQWSEIFTDTGLHTIRAQIPELTDFSDSSIIYRSSSDEVSHTVSGSIQPPFPPTPPQPESDGSAMAIVALITVAVVGVGIGIALSKRKKKLPAIQTPYAKSSPTPIKPDDTQFWVCPHCGKDTEMYLGKQYCRNCNVYL